jgi:hypothetical protein
VLDISLPKLVDLTITPRDRNTWEDTDVDDKNSLKLLTIRMRLYYPILEWAEEEELQENNGFTLLYGRDD